MQDAVWRPLSRDAREGWGGGGIMTTLTVLSLLIWMYLLAAIALFGCEFNAEYERLSVSAPPAWRLRSARA